MVYPSITPPDPLVSVLSFSRHPLLRSSSAFLPHHPNAWIFPSVRRVLLYLIYPFLRPTMREGCSMMLPVISHHPFIDSQPQRISSIIELGQLALPPIRVSFRFPIQGVSQSMFFHLLYNFYQHIQGYSGEWCVIRVQFPLQRVTPSSCVGSSS